MHSPKRFIDEITSFEYLFEKLVPDKARSKKYPLREELKYMFDAFSEVLSGTNTNSDKISKCIKELRMNIVHGYAYYYDFTDNSIEQYYTMKIAS
jgi:hypothetical protein